MNEPLHADIQLLRDTATLVMRHASYGTVAKSHIKLLADAVARVPGLADEVAEASQGREIVSCIKVDIDPAQLPRIVELLERNRAMVIEAFGAGKAERTPTAGGFEQLKEGLINCGAAVPETFEPLGKGQPADPAALVTEGEYSEVATAFALLRQQCLNALTSWRQGTYTVQDRSEIAQTICRLPGLAQEVMYASTAKAMQERPAEDDERHVSASPALAAPYGEQTGIPINLCFLATAIETADWSGVSIGNKALLVAAVQTLRDLHGPR